MGLYSGFNALGLGQAANAMHENRRANSKELIELITKFGSKVAEKKEEERRKAALLDSARGMGVDNAEGLASGMNADELARYLQGISAAKENEKIADARQKKQWGREDLVRSDERAYSEKQADKKREQEALDKGFSTLSQAYLADITKMKDNVLPSQKDLDESARIQGDLMKFVKEHPEYGFQLATSLMQAGEGMKTAPTIESRFADLDAVMKDGVVDPKAMQELKERLIAENVWAALNENKDWQAKWNLLAGKVEGDKLARDALMLGSGNAKTEGDAKKALDDRERQKKINAEKEKMRKAFKAGEAFDFSELERLGALEEMKKDRKYIPYFRAFERNARKGRK